MKKNKSLAVSLGLILTFIVSICIHPMSAFAADNIPITSYDAFRNAVIGKKYDVDGYPTDQPYQCYDGAAILWKQLGRSLNTGGNDAKGTWLNARYENAGNDFHLITNINDVKRGDVVVFDYNATNFNGTYYDENGNLRKPGHIAYADNDYAATHTLNILGQNQLGKPYFTVQQNVSVDSFLGAFRLKTWGPAPIVDLGASFDGYLIATKPWIHIVMNKDTENVELESSNAERFTARNCWRFDRQSDGSYIITSLYNGKVLDVDGASSANGTNVQVYTRWGDDNAAQRWFMCTDGTMAPKLDTTKRLDVQSGSMVNGGNIQIYSANGTDAQFIYPYNRTNDSNDPFPTGMTIDSELTVPVGEQATVHSTFTPQNSRNIFWGIEWSSSDKSVATVDNKGVVTGIKAGKATITAVSTFNDHWTAQCEVTVGSLIQVPEISSLTVTGYKVDLSWEASPLTDENDEREYEVNVYKKDALEVPEQTFTGLTGTDLQFTVDSHGDYVVTVTAVNAADGSRSKDSSRAFIVLDEEWLYYDELPEDLPECEIQYLNHYDSIESAQSPGDGWVRGKSRKIYTDAGIMYSPDPNPLQESDTLVLLGTYYYHYCNGNGTVEHYRTDSFNHEVILDNWDGRFEIVWQGADDSDSRYTVYRLKWLQGEYAGYAASCSEGSDLYYRGYRYQKKNVTTVYTWTKEDSWSEEPDPNADSVSYRVREVTYENKLVLPAGTERIEQEAFLNNTSIEEVTVPEGCANIESRAFAGCTGLKRVYIPNNTEVADDAFEGCGQVVIIRY